VLLIIAYHYTRPKAQQPSTKVHSETEYSDVEPSDVAPVAATSSPSLSSVRLSVAAGGAPESMAIESAGPVSVPIHPSSAGRSSFHGGLGVLGPAGSPPVGVSLGYPSGLAGPSELHAHGVEQVSSSSVTTGTATPPPPALAAAPDNPPASRQPPPLLAAVTAAATSLTTVQNFSDLATFSR